MVVELINTGTELMLGRVLNTHQQWLCRQLTDNGYLVSRQVAVPDTGPAIVAAVKEALSRADLVITTGGLGPTSDDITRALIAEMLGKKLREDSEVANRIESYFASRKRPMPASTRVQAQVPEGAIVLQNDFGTAPGLAMPVESGLFRAGGARSWIVMLPGPPRELRPMFTDKVLPLLREMLPKPGKFVCSTLRTTGIGESVVEETIAGALRELCAKGLQIGYCARPGQVDVRLTALGDDAEELVSGGSQIVRALLGASVCGVDDEDIETVVVRLLTEKKATLALAESCTGGLIAHRITNVPGASAVLMAGLVTYSNASKHALLGVDAQVIARHGAVSQEVALAMAEGALARTGADYAVAVTGIAGPSGGSPEKPVGTVFIAVAGRGETKAARNFNSYDRETFKNVTSQQALEMLRRRILS